MKLIIYIIFLKVDGGWSSWTKWSNCSKTCGEGVSKRVRLCDNPPQQGNGTICQGINSESKSCKISNCPVINGKWSVWSSWSECDKTCEQGLKVRIRLK